MSAAARVEDHSDRRARLLRALDIVPWVQRAAPVSGPHDASAADARLPCVVVLPADCTTRELDLLGRALVAGGAALARAPRLLAEQGQLRGHVPDAVAYLVFGQAQAHALGRVLPAQTMHRAQILLADDPATILTQADAKQRLWTALRSVRRAINGRED